MLFISDGNSLQQRMPMSKRRCFWFALLVIFAFKLGPAAILTMNMRVTPTPNRPPKRVRQRQAPGAGKGGNGRGS